MNPSLLTPPIHLTNSPSPTTGTASDYMTGLQAICVVVVAAFGVFAWFARRLLDDLKSGLTDLKGRVGDQQANDINDLRNKVDRLKNRISDQDLPVGTTVMFPILSKKKLSSFQDHERRFRLCNGGTLKKAEFHQLYSLIGDAYRRPDCQDDEFNLPDFTDRYLRGGGGADQDGTDSGGRFGGTLEIQGMQAKVDLRARTSEDGEHDHRTFDRNSNWYIRKLPNSSGPCTMVDCRSQDPNVARTGNGGRHSHDVHVKGPVSVSGRIEPTFARVHVFIKVK